MNKPPQSLDHPRVMNLERIEPQEKDGIWNPREKEERILIMEV